MPRISKREIDYEILSSSDIFRKFVYNLPDFIQAEIYYGNYNKVFSYMESLSDVSRFKIFGIDDITVKENYIELITDMNTYGF